MSLFLLIVIWIVYLGNKHTTQPVQIVKTTDQVTSSKYIIDTKLIRESLQSQSQIVSYNEQIDKHITYVDTTWLGKRVTQFEFRGVYKMGLNTKDIHITNLDNGIVHIKLGKPIIISMELPFDQMTDSKTQGFFRGQMTEQDKQKVYSQIVKQIKSELINDNNVMKTAELYNESVVKDLLSKIPGVKDVVFEEGNL